MGAGVLEGWLVEEEELFVGTFWLLDAAGSPGVENLWFHDWHLLEVAIIIARPFPRRLYFALIIQLTLVSQPRDIRLPLDLSQLPERSILDLGQVVGPFSGKSVH